MKPEEAKIKLDQLSFNYERWTDLLRQIPVSVNNFYGDPVIQWPDTVKKLENLVKSGHIGPVGIITKGKLAKNHLEDLKHFQDQGLRLVVFLSISELPQFEKIGMEHRYDNIGLLNSYGIPNIAYIRPLTPPYNTSQETIDMIFAKLKSVGAKTFVAAGFRGDDKLIAEMTPDQKVQWALRVKIMTKELYNLLKQKSEENNMRFFTRTSCAISCVLGDQTTYNPYYNCPNLVHCEELKCPIRNTCRPPLDPKSGSLELLRFLGYQIEQKEGDASQKCQVQGDNRLNCPSCCTTCYVLKTPRLEVEGRIKLGDLTFIRFVSGMIAMQPGRRDDGDKEIGNVEPPDFPDMKGMQCLNSWWPYSHVGDRCYDCKYCIERYYGSDRRDYGFPPAELLDKIKKILENECHTNSRQINMAVRSPAVIA